MATKKTTKKTAKTVAARSKKKPTAKKAASAAVKKKAPAAKKVAVKKAVTKKAVTKKAVTKKVTKKAVTKKVTKKTAAKKVVTKKVAKKTAAKKAVTKKVTKKKAAGKKTRRKIDFTNPKSVAAVAVATAAERDADGYIFISGRRVRAISTKGMTLKKKTKTPKVDAVATAMPDTDVSTIKTKMLKKELDVFKELLLEKRHALVGNVTGLEKEALKSGNGSHSAMPIHMADVGSDAFQQDFSLGLAETERARLLEIDAALVRIQDKTYGICQATGKPIPKARLKAKPWAKFTVEAARANERAAAAAE